MTIIIEYIINYIGIFGINLLMILENKELAQTKYKYDGLKIL